MDRGEIDGRMHRMGLAIAKPLEPARSVSSPHPNSYNVGPLTMARVFEPNAIVNVSDWQRVLDAVEAALAG